MNYKLTTSFVISALAVGVSYPVMADDVQSQNTQSVLTTIMNTNTNVQSETAQDTQSKATTANDNSYNQISHQISTQVQSVQADSTTTADDQSKLFCPAPVQNTNSIAPYVNKYSQKVANGWNYNKGTNQWSGSTYTPTEEEQNQPITPNDPRFEAYQASGSNNWSAIKGYLTVDSNHNVNQTWYKATPDDSANYQITVYDPYGNFLYTHKYNTLNNMIADDSDPTVNDKDEAFHKFITQPDVNTHISYVQSYLGNGWYQFDGYENNNVQFMSHLVKIYWYNPQYNLLTSPYTTDTHKNFDNDSCQNNAINGTVDSRTKSDISNLDTVSDQNNVTDNYDSSSKTLSKVSMPGTTDINKGKHHTDNDKLLSTTTSADHLPQTGNDYSTNDVIVIGMILLATVLIVIFGI